MTDMIKHQVGKLLETEAGFRPECPHCLYNGGDDPKTGHYPFLLFEDVVTGRALRMDKPGDPLSLDESDFASDYQAAQNPRFSCGDCEGEFALSIEDFERLIRSDVGY
jgi:hypothetical protein